MNGKAFRYVHHYMNEQVFGCRGGGLGGGKILHTYALQTGRFVAMDGLPDCRSIFAGNWGETFGY